MRYLVLLIALSPLPAADFGKTLFPVLEKAGCPGCHKDNGVASATRLHFPDEKLEGADLETFGRSLVTFVDRANPEQSLLLRKPTLRIAHGGGKRIEPGSADETALREWVLFLAKSAPTQPVKLETKHEAIGPVLRRLTHAQYNNTIRDLLGDYTRLADQFPPEDFVNGFRNQYQAQNTSPLLAEAYSAAAEKLARKAFLGGDSQGLIPCKPASHADAACRDRFLRAFGRKAFRRPLLDSEVKRYGELFRSEAAGKKSFLAGAQLIVELMLQSPNFLMRVEGGLDPALRPYELASKLSYFLWNSMPDEQLLHAAESGALNSGEGVAREARRLLASPKAHETLDEFTAEWLRFDRLSGTVRDRRLYRNFTLELTLSMMEETRRLVSDLAWNKRNFMELFSANYTFLNSDLAKLYGMPAPAEEYAKVEMPASTGRAGILAHASFLTMTSKPGETSPTARGLFVREQFLCQEVPQPPPGVNTNLPPVEKEKPRTTRDRLQIHLSNPSCASCHRLIDPIGFGMEKYDAIGAFRERLLTTVATTKDDEDESSRPKKVELDLDTSGNVIGLPNAAFTSPRELGIILSSSAECQRCVVKQLFRWMAGRHETPADRVVIDRAFADFRQSGFDLEELLVSLAKWSTYAPEESN